MSMYTTDVLDMLKAKYPWEKEYIQSVSEVFKSITPVLDSNLEYQNNRILEQLVEPDRSISFRVPWKDDQGRVQVNTGHRVQFNNVLGPYKGGLRFHASVTLSIIKCLGFEQIFKNALTGLRIGGGKGGSDFNPRGKSDNEIMNFCQSFMLELSRHIGATIDVPAGDIGVGGREIGYLFGMYRRMNKSFEGVLTGKGIAWGGSYLRPEATGYGVVYFAEEMLKNINDNIDGKVVTVSGFGNVSWGVVKKVNELGGKVITLSGPDGFIHDPEGVTGEKVDYMLKLRLSGNDVVKDYADRFKVKFYPGKRPWDIPCDIAFPCATQNELDLDDAKNLVKNKVKALVEGANLPTTLDAMEFLETADIIYGPAKACNAGGVACSCFEMAQNAIFMNWTEEEVDVKLHQVMKHIHDQCYETSAEFNKKGNYVFGANVAGFRRVADAMLDQGLS
ncbi:NADP-specific glutamate dehydrogenase [Desulfobacula sp.]|uniref:NADP-specific glutamate dehydrogenase n=1 Tax=Desulfobacula sp. TaxID=2593537 RepID=UPI002714A4D9|nr:NADP-specific glutamate dehydrogenase [Desulfobacula sp.]